MQRALTWLNLYGCEAVRHNPKNSLKTPKRHFLPIFELMSDSFTHQCPLHQLQSYTSKDQSQKLSRKKYWELVKPWKWLLFSFWLLGCSKKNFVLFLLNEKNQGGSYEVVFISELYADGFFRILKKTVSELICTRL